MDTKTSICVICQENEADDINHFPCNCGVRFHNKCWDEFIKRGIIYCPYCRKTYEIRLHVPNLRIDVQEDVQFEARREPIIHPFTPPRRRPRLSCKLLFLVLIFTGLTFEAVRLYDDNMYDFSIVFFLDILCLLLIIYLRFRVIIAYIGGLTFFFSIYCQVLFYNEQLNNDVSKFIALLFCITLYIFLVMMLSHLCMTCCKTTINVNWECCFCETFDGDIEYCSFIGIICIE